MKTVFCYRCGKSSENCEMIATQETPNKVLKWACEEHWWEVTVTRKKKEAKIKKMAEF